MSSMICSDLNFQGQLAVGRFLEMRMWRAVENHAAMLGDEKTAAYAYAAGNGAKRDMYDYAKDVLESEGSLEQMKKSLKCKTEAGVIRKINRQRSQYWKMIRRMKSDRGESRILPVEGLI